MQEGTDAKTPSAQEWNAFIDSTIAKMNGGVLNVAKGTHNPIHRLEAARSKQPDAKRFYAATRLMQRAERAMATHMRYLESYAESFGSTVSDAEMEFELILADATMDPLLCASPGFIRMWESDPEHDGLLVDRKSRYAYEQMEINRSARDVECETRPAVTLSPVDHSSISHMGYDPINGRLEVILGAYPERIYAYRMSPSEYGDFNTSKGTLDSRFTKMVRNNPDAQYADGIDAEEASMHRRCAPCGQFRGIEHTCPAVGSVESINRDTRIAIKASIEGNDFAPTDPDKMRRGRTTQYLSEYSGGSIAMRIPGISRITAEARRMDTVRFPVDAIFRANLALNAKDAGSPNSVATVSGLATMIYAGRGRGYTVLPVLEPGDSGTDHLRCDCLTYQARRVCDHLSIATNRIASMASGFHSAIPATQKAVETTREKLTQLFGESINLTNKAIGNWHGMTTSFEENPTVFNEIYAKSLVKIQEYKTGKMMGENDSTNNFPIPYLRKNAFGGLAKRGSRRGFGTEIEFSFPLDMGILQRTQAIQAIGLALQEAGLLSSPEQKAQGEVRTHYSDTHQNGWAFEKDDTTNYASKKEGAHAGGEIISPIMFDEEETWTNLEKVCNILKSHGAIASRGAGSHVHVGTGDYDHRVENHNRLLQSYSENEDLIYRISSNPDRGAHRSETYCHPNTMPSSPYASVDKVTSWQRDHHDALNLESVRGQASDHVEFRTFDSTLNPNIIQAQIGLSVYMAEGAIRPGGSTSPNENRSKLGSHSAKYGREEVLTEEEQNESTRIMRRFIDRFVPGSSEADRENPRVEQLITLFAMTRWQNRHFVASPVPATTVPF
jgi:hypothetical protein